MALAPGGGCIRVSADWPGIFTWELQGEVVPTRPKARCRLDGLGIFAMFLRLPFLPVVASSPQLELEGLVRVDVNGLAEDMTARSFRHLQA